MEVGGKREQLGALQLASMDCQARGPLAALHEGHAHLQHQKVHKVRGEQPEREQLGA